MPEECRHVNIHKWGQDAITVLKAVTENDELVSISGLSYISNQKKLLVALDEFRQIMIKNVPVLEPGSTSYKML